MTLHIKKVLSFILILCLAFSLPVLSGCEEDKLSVYFGIDSEPKNIDPQKAETYAELLAVRNCFRGLYKLDGNCNAVPDLAESYAVSDDGLTYIFTLVQSQWRDGRPVTADDFQFGFKRASDPLTASPSYNRLKNIKSVTAEAENIVKIVLNQPDCELLSELTLAVFMPCNREFFESCGGKYGLGREYILTNGSYYPSQWLENKHLKLTYSGEVKKGQPLNVYLSVSATGKDTVSRILNNEIDITVNSLTDFTCVNTSKYTVETVYQKTYALVFNRKSEVGGLSDLTEAFAKAVDREVYSAKMSTRFKPASTVLPKDSLIFSSKLSSVNVPEYVFSFDSMSAREQFLKGIKKLKNEKLPQFSVLTVENKEIQAVLTEVVSQWQANLGAYINITSVKSEQELLSKLKTDDFTVAFVPFSGEATEILKEFSDESSPFYLGLEDYNRLTEALSTADSRETTESTVENCLEILSKQSAIIPIMTVPTAYIYGKSFENVKFSHLDSTVDFSKFRKSK